MQTKQNSGTISPQITFLASQGAHVPSVNAPQQQPINRIFTTEKSTMPQLVNYEANMKEPDQESNKALWRWQYGINANANQNNNMEKNSISRSFGADDIVINFSDMNSEQYTKMIKEQLNPTEKQNPETTHQEGTPSFKETDYYVDYKPNSDLFGNDNLKPEIRGNSNDNQYSTERILPVTYATATSQLYTDKNQYDSKKNYLQNNHNYMRHLRNESSQTSRPKLITQQQFIPQSQTVTQTYNYNDDDFESRRTKILNEDTSYFNYNDYLNVLPLSYEKYLEYNAKPEKKETTNELIITVSPETPTIEITTKLSDFSTMSTVNSSNLKFSDFIVPENRDDFKPIFKFTEPEPTTATTEASISIFEENIFLKNLFRYNKNEHELNNNIREENNNKIQTKQINNKNEKHPKFIQQQTKPHNENKATSKKPADIADILNYISRNQFESSRLKSPPKQAPNNFKQKNELRHYTPEQVEDTRMIEDNQNRNQRTLQQQEELRGVIKNYKVLHRNNNFQNVEQDDFDGLRRNLSPPHLKSLPPLGRAGPSMKSYLPPIYV